MKKGAFKPHTWKVKIRITRRVRSQSGFIVTGPDGQVYRCPTKAEAMSNLKVRMKCHEVQPWRVEVVYKMYSETKGL